jgi:hypothetical protein
VFFRREIHIYDWPFDFFFFEMFLEWFSSFFSFSFFFLKKKQTRIATWTYMPRKFVGCSDSVRLRWNRVLRTAFGHS